jgi:hypothetical protein
MKLTPKQTLFCFFVWGVGAAMFCREKVAKFCFSIFYGVGGLEFHEFSSSGSADMVAVRRRDGYRARALEKATHTHKNMS